MSGSTRFVTYVSLSLGDQWQWTRPCISPEKSYEAAENMVSAYLMEDKGVPRRFDNFGLRVRQLYPEIVREARLHIGETREVSLEESMTPKEFQRKFHQVGC